MGVHITGIKEGIDSWYGQEAEWMGKTDHSSRLAFARCFWAAGRRLTGPIDIWQPDQHLVIMHVIFVALLAIGSQTDR